MADLIRTKTVPKVLLLVHTTKHNVTFVLMQVLIIELLIEGDIAVIWLIDSS